MGEKQAIEISQQITLHVSLPLIKVKLPEEINVSDRIPCKTPKAIVDFEGLVFFVIDKRIIVYH